MKLRSNNQHGFTLTELLITTALSGFVGMAAYTVFSSSNWSATVQQDVSQTQQSVRAATDRLAKDLRSAGFGTPDPPFTMNFVNGSETLTVTSPISITNSASGPDSLTIVGIGTEVARLTGSGSGCNQANSTLICLNNVDYFKNSSGTFMEQRRYISVGGITPFHLRTGTYQTELANRKLAMFEPLGQAYPDGTPVFIIQAVVYSITTDSSIEGCSTTKPCLVGRDWTDLRGANRQLYAEGIEDMQLAYFLQGGSGFVNNASTADTNLMAVRLNLVARTLNSDPKAPTGQPKICLEDRAGDSACTSASDGYRRRALTQLVMIRNPRTGS